MHIDELRHLCEAAGFRCVRRAQAPGIMYGRAYDRMHHWCLYIPTDVIHGYWTTGDDEYDVLIHWHDIWCKYDGDHKCV